MTDEELKAAAQAAAMLGGDWAVSPHESTDKWIDVCGGDIRVDNDDVPNNPFDQGPAFAAYISAASPATVLRILDERDTYRAEAERLTRERDELVALAERRRDAIRERDRLIEERNKQLAETTAEFERVAGERDAATTEVTRLRKLLGTAVYWWEAHAENYAEQMDKPICEEEAAAIEAVRNAASNTLPEKTP